MPPINSKLVHLEFAGVSASAKWATGLWCTADLGAELPEIATVGYANLVEAKFSDLWQNGLGALNGPGTLYSITRARFYNANETAATAESSASPGAAHAGSGMASSPASTACVCTLLSLGVGRSSRGRMYLPATAATSALDNEFQFDVAKLTTLANALAAFFNAVHDLRTPGGASLVPVVRSPTKGIVSRVLRVRVNSQPDRQEHREAGISFDTITRDLAV